MAAPGATPIILYHSTTASAQPSTANLAVGELGVNVTDKKIYSKDGGGALITLVGTLGNQAANAVAITGGSISGTTITGNITGNATTATSSTRITNAGGWSVTPSGANLYFNYNGTNVGVLTSAGNFTVIGNVTAFGTV